MTDSSVIDSIAESMKTLRDTAYREKIERIATALFAALLTRPEVEDGDDVEYARETAVAQAECLADDIAALKMD